MNYYYEYNPSGEVVRGFTTNQNRQKIYEFQNIYDSSGCLTSFFTNIGGVKNTTKYTYTNIDAAQKTEFYSGGSVSHTYESVLKRPVLKTIVPKKGVAAAKKINTEYTYLSGKDPSGKSSGQTYVINTLTNKIGTVKQSSYIYEYDAAGNISHLIDNGKHIYYAYDSLYQLIREDNEVLGKTILYNYDVGKGQNGGGNIIGKAEYAYIRGTVGKALRSVIYTYDGIWRDKLTNYNGQSIVYDSIGNPTQYRGNTLIWEQGRQLNKYGASEYKYNADGQRIEKVTGDKVVEYIIIGGRIIQEKHPSGSAGRTYNPVVKNNADKVVMSDGNIATVNVGAMLHLPQDILSATGAEGELIQNYKDSLTFLYDSDGSLIGFTGFDGKNNYYGRNAQGDITEIYSEDSVLLCRYIYDSWGKLISIKDAAGDDKTSDVSFIGNINPFRYRGP